jgi:methionyl aminopeptidase
MIARKTKEEIAIMQEGGAKLGVIRDTLMDFARPGVVLHAIEDYATKLIDATGGSASFKMVSGYHWATCLCVNEVVVHGIPNAYVLKDGDILTIDVGLYYRGFHTDTASTRIIGNDPSPDSAAKERFLEVGRQTLNAAIDLCRIGNRVGEISASNQRIIEGAGYSVVKSLVGHGVGHDLHEEPQIPNYTRGANDNTYQFQGGETIAIEPIYVMGNPSVVYENDDGWTISTRDRSPAAVFEHSVAITEDGPLVLTKGRI